MAVNLSTTCRRSPSPAVSSQHQRSDGLVTSSPELLDRSHDSTMDVDTTPNRRKNKRKMSEPRRLSDFSVKRFCVENDNDSLHEDNSLIRSETSPDDSGVETSGASAGDPGDEVDAPRIVPGLQYPPPPLMLHAFLPYPYAYGVAPPNGLGGLHALSLISGANPQTSVPSHSNSSAKSRKIGRDSPTVEDQPRSSSPKPESSCSDDGTDGGRKNYKSMTVERRIEANARERTRVHTISAAFEALRRSVPAYSYNQKLSKLAILRIACCYILSLSRLADRDYSRDQSRPSFGECVDLTTRTIQAEGRAKKRH